MISFFTIPRAFEGDVAVRQRNSLTSLCRLTPKCQVIVVGDESGIRDVADELGLTHVPFVERNEFGTPLLSSAFRGAQSVARFATMAYVNTDIILLNDFLEAVRRIPFGDFLMAGRRWNIALAERVDFDAPEWASRLKAFTQVNGKLFTHDGMDYFVFRRGMFAAMPPFAVGRPGWDNWMVYSARAKGAPVIDATAAVMAIHQDHDYRHVQQSRGRWKGPEGDTNVVLMGGGERIFTLYDATWVLGRRWILPAWGKEHRARWPEARRVLRPRLTRFLDDAARWSSLAHWKGMYWRLRIRIGVFLRRSGRKS